MNINYYDLMECDLPASFGEIIKNPVAVIFYLFCLYVLIGWIVYSIFYLKKSLLKL
jgi:hypothetical protein